MTRVTPLEGVHNFRNFHGYEGLDGARVRDGLYRSGHFSRSSEADRDFFKSLDIAVVADLRRPRERALEPSNWDAALGLRVIDSDHDDHDEPPHLQFMRKGDLSAEAVKGYMMSAYRRIPMEEGNQVVFREAFRALASGEADSGFLVHCAAGKDRTGIFCALVLGELGVGYDVIRGDYELTNSAVDYDSLVPKVQDRMQDMLGKQVDEASLRTFLGVDGALLDEAFATIGNVDRYLRETLDISDDERDALRARWLER